MYNVTFLNNCPKDADDEHFAVQFLNSTKNLAKLKQLLGHSTIRSTEHYLKYTVEDIREEYREAFR